MYSVEHTNEIQALDKTCLIRTQPEDAPLNEWGLGGATTETETVLTHKCYSIPQRTIIDREHGTINTIPAQLIVMDRARSITTSHRVTFDGRQYRITEVMYGDTGDPLAKIILQEE
jgi:hypothetical protein